MGRVVMKTGIVTVRFLNTLHCLNIYYNREHDRRRSALLLSMYGMRSVSVTSGLKCHPS